MKDLRIAVFDDRACGLTPILPFLGKKFDGGHFASVCKLYLSAALLRCDIDVVDVNPKSAEIGFTDAAISVNRTNADAFIVLSYAAFGSRRTFNDFKGMCVAYPSGRFERESRVMSEDVTAALGAIGTVQIRPYGISAVSCPMTTVFGGFTTNFDEAKLIHDPDYATAIAERAAMGICEFFDMPYIPRDDISCYPLLSPGRRGKKVKMLKCLLNVYGAGLLPSGAFDGATAAAVRGFSARNGRGEIKAADAELWRDLLLADLPTLDKGSRNTAVHYVKQKLLSKLYNPGDGDSFDGDTERALSEFLRDEAGVDMSYTAERIDKDVYNLLLPIGGGKQRVI